MTVYDDRELPTTLADWCYADAAMWLGAAFIRDEGRAGSGLDGGLPRTAPVTLCRPSGYEDGFRQVRVLRVSTHARPRYTSAVASRTGSGRAATAAAAAWKRAWASLRRLCSLSASATWYRATAMSSWSGPCSHTRMSRAWRRRRSASPNRSRL